LRCSVPTSSGTVPSRPMSSCLRTGRCSSTSTPLGRAGQRLAGRSGPGRRAGRLAPGAPPGTPLMGERAWRRINCSWRCSAPPRKGGAPASCSRARPCGAWRRPYEASSESSPRGAAIPSLLSLCWQRRWPRCCTHLAGATSPRERGELRADPTGWDLLLSAAASEGHSGTGRAPLK